MSVAKLADDLAIMRQGGSCMFEYADAQCLAEVVPLLVIAANKFEGVEWAHLAPGVKSTFDPLGLRGYIGFTTRAVRVDSATTAGAKAQLVAAAGDVGDNADSLDKAADALLERVAQFFGECVGGSTFCGLSTDEVRDANGLLLSIRFVACDAVNGEPVRRVGR